MIICHSQSQGREAKEEKPTKEEEPSHKEDPSHKNLPNHEDHSTKDHLTKEKESDEDINMWQQYVVNGVWDCEY